MTAFHPLISVTELQRRLSDAKLTIVDCRFDLMKPEAGKQAYLAGHIPGAVYAHLDDDLSGPKTPQTGRHPLPVAAALKSTFGRLGIDRAQFVVAYDGDNGMFASRLWWLLRWMDHNNVAVLDGGFKAWQLANLPVSTSLPAPEARTFVGDPKSNFIVKADEVAMRSQAKDWRLLDARAPERFRGDVEPIDPVAGHIPGARNHPFAWNLAADGRFESPETLRKKYNVSLGSVAADRTMAMCGSGVTACHTLLAMEVAGLHGAKLYPGSWSEWIKDPSRPIAKGDAS